MTDNNTALKLYAIVLGGRADGCNVELHDVVFAVGHTLEDTYPSLPNKWFGNKKRLHIDSTIELSHVDGHEVVIKTEKPPHDKRIYFVNFGGYKSNYFGELHENSFYVASSKPEVLARAKSQLCLNYNESHCDDNLIVDDVIPLQEIDHYYIHLNPSLNRTPLNIKSMYRRL